MKVDSWVTCSACDQVFGPDEMASAYCLACHAAALFDEKAIGRALLELYLSLSLGKWDGLESLAGVISQAGRVLRESGLLLEWEEET